MILYIIDSTPNRYGLSSIIINWNYSPRIITTIKIKHLIWQIFRIFCCSKADMQNRINGMMIYSGTGCCLAISMANCWHRELLNLIINMNCSTKTKKNVRARFRPERNERRSARKNFYRVIRLRVIYYIENDAKFEPHMYDKQISTAAKKQLRPKNKLLPSFVVVFILFSTNTENNEILR